MNKLALALVLAPLATVAVPAVAGAQGFQASIAIGPSFAPPAAPVEAQPAAPAPGYVWVAGHYQWTGAQYTWIAGHWELPPYQGATWVAPRWGHQGRYWSMTPGSWTRPVYGAYAAPRPVYGAPYAQPVYTRPYVPAQPVYTRPYAPARPVYVGPANHGGWGGHGGWGHGRR